MSIMSSATDYTMTTMSVQVANSSTTETPFIGLTGAEYVFDFITDALMYFGPFLVSFGIFTNTVNMIIFSRIGLKDTVSIALFSLSLSDHLYLSVYFVVNMLVFVDMHALAKSIDVLGVIYILTCYNDVLLDISIMTTTFISIQRCCCVAFPLHFKGTFTENRTFIIIGIIYIVIISSYLPLLSSVWLYTWVNPATNSTLVTVYYGPSFEVGIAIFDTFNRLVIPITTQIIVMFCLAFFTVSLRAASKFRHSVSATVNSEEKNKKLQKKENIDRKEIQVVQAVMFVALLFIVFNTPSIMIAVTKFFLPGFHYGGSLRVIFLMVVSLRLLGEKANATFNFFIYLKYNSKYRETFLNMFPVFRSAPQKS